MYRRREKTLEDREFEFEMATEDCRNKTKRII